MVTEKARAGDLQATALLWKYLMPRRPFRQVAVNTPPIVQSNDAEVARSTVTQAVLDGNIAAGDAEAMIRIIEREGKARAADESLARHKERVAALRKQFERDDEDR